MFSSLSDRLKQCFTLITCLIIISTFLFIHHTTNQLYHTQIINNTAILKCLQRRQTIDANAIYWMKHLNITDLYFNHLPEIENFSTSENFIIYDDDDNRLIGSQDDDDENFVNDKFNLSIDGFDPKIHFKGNFFFFLIDLNFHHRIFYEFQSR